MEKNDYKPVFEKFEEIKSHLNAVIDILQRQVKPSLSLKARVEEIRFYVKKINYILDAFNH